jgi:hypothetical protein
MEENTPESLLDMHLDYDGGNTLRETVRWSKFFSIVGIVCLGLFILVFALAGPRIIALLGETYPNLEDMGILYIILLLIVVLVGGCIVFMLYRFSILMRNGIESQDQVLFNRGLKGLKTYFLVSGILGLLALVFHLLTLTTLF